MQSLLFYNCSEQALQRETTAQAVEDTTQPAIVYGDVNMDVTLVQKHLADLG